RYTGAPVFEQRFEKCLSELPEIVAHLRTFKNLDAKQKTALDHIDKTVNRLITIAADSRLSIAQGGKGYEIGFLSGLQVDAETTLNQLNYEFEELIARDRQIEVNAPRERQRSRTLLGLILTGGVVLNIGIAVALSLLFSRDISRRVQQVVNNTNLL